MAEALIPWSRSSFTVSIGGQTVTDRIAPFLISLSVTDKAGSTSDVARILLDDAGGRFEIPAKGTPVSISLGTTARGVVEVFTGTVDTARSRGDRGGGMTLEINAKGMDTTSGAKEPQESHYDDKSLGDVMGEAAKSAGLKGAKVHASLASISRPYWSQDGESLIAFGRRVAGEVGATFKVVGDEVVMVPRNAGLSASGKPLSPITVARGVNLISWDVAPDSGRPVYSEFVARYFDDKEAKWIERKVSADTAEGGSNAARRQRIMQSRADEGESDGAAGAESKDADRDKGGGTLTIDGDPRVFAEAPVILSGLRPQVDGEYTAETVEHSLSRTTGFVTKIDVVRPKVGAGSSGGGSE